MHLTRRCVPCPGALPICPSCNNGYQCQISYGTCEKCASAECVASAPQNSSKGGANSGAIAGGVLAALVVLLLGIGYLWYRRRAQAAAAAFKRATVEVKPEVVASADTVLNRPDPLEKPPSYLGQDDSIYLAPLGPPENPFSDHASIATASDRATNVIPIGLVTPSSASMALSQASQAPSATAPSSIAPSSTFTVQVTEDPLSRSVPNTPTRPRRGPEIDMRLDLARPISETPSLLAPPKIPYAGSSRSGLSGVSSRASTISTSSSFLNEAPQIVTPKQANFRQVLGVQRAAVVQLGSTPTSPAASLKSHPSTSTLGKSPLSQQAYDANDVNGTLDQNANNPFADYNMRPDTADSKVSNSTFGTSAHGNESASPLGWDGSERPMSAMSHAESIVNISSAQRVQFIRPVAHGVGEARALLAPPSPSSATPRSADFRSAGQLSPPAQAIPRSFDDAMDYRMSQSSLALTNRTSTTDSILEAFPFVPPSPISLHHNQPSSPLQRAVMQQQQRQAAAHLAAAESEAPSAAATSAAAKPGRMTLGLSTISSTSSGLGSFPFQFDEDVPPPPTLAQEHNSDRSSRASLDTLQLSRDLADFPLPLETPATPRGPAPPR